MTFENRFVLRGKSQVWLYNGGCDYECNFHKEKVEWHHPCSKDGIVGLWLCEAHHSLLKDRKKRYLGELTLNKSLSEMKAEIETLVENKVGVAGLTLNDIDKF